MTTTAEVLQDRDSRITAARFCLRLAEAEDRPEIYRMRHEVYARELRQHSENDRGQLSDPLDERNQYLVAELDGRMAGFVSLTPPGGRFSLDKYLSRSQLPFEIGPGVFEVRILTVATEWRSTPLATLLMYAALRAVESQGGTRIVAIGRTEVLELYQKAGLRGLGRTVECGAVRFELVSEAVQELRANSDRRREFLERLRQRIEWQLPWSFWPPPACFHGGAFWEAIGPGFEDLSRPEAIVNADVLDAWFPPAPGVISALREQLPFLLRTSPPTDCRGFVEAVAKARDVPANAVLPGSGSSDLIFRAFLHWCRPESRVLLLDPTYGEYAHVLERVVGCRVDRLELGPENGFAVDLDELVLRLRRKHDLVVIVNPNSPTGQHVPRRELEEALSTAPPSTRVWIDETYVDYVETDLSRGAGILRMPTARAKVDYHPADGTRSVPATFEQFAAGSENVVVCKSMSKAYALSGARVAYLVGPSGLIADLRGRTPPWAVSLPAQLAAVRALQDPEYYQRRYAETNALRRRLAADLAAAIPGLKILPGTANFLLCFLPEESPTAAEIVERCRASGVYLRNAAGMGARLGPQALRIAVKDAASNARIVQTLAEKILPNCY